MASKPWLLHGHGRIPSKMDSGDDNFQLSMLQTQLRGGEPPKPPPKKRTLSLSWCGDQGRSSMCVAFAGMGMLRTKPGKFYLSKLTEPAIYQGAQMHDEIPGEGYQGTTTRGLLEFLVNYQPAEDIQSYWWVKEIEETIDWIGGETPGPVLWGIGWPSSFYTPDKEGIVRKGKSQVVDGHEILQVGYDLKRGLLEFQNSWGKGWGKGGRFWIPMEDAMNLLDAEGEAAVAVKWPKYKVVDPVVGDKRKAESGKPPQGLL